MILISVLQFINIIQMKTQCNYFSHLENGEKVYSLKKEI